MVIHYKNTEEHESTDRAQALISLEKTKIYVYLA